MEGRRSRTEALMTENRKREREMNIQLYKMVMKLYPWVSEKEARRIADKAEKQRNDFMYDEAQKLKAPQPS